MKVAAAQIVAWSVARLEVGALLLPEMSNRSVTGSKPSMAEEEAVWNAKTAISMAGLKMTATAGHLEISNHAVGTMDQFAIVAEGADMMTEADTVVPHKQTTSLLLMMMSDVLR